MQNFDFYDRSNRQFNPQYEKYMDMPDPEYFSRLTQNHTKEQEKKQKSASRTLFFMVALCIVTFTAGLVIGLKFAGGTKYKLVDKDTMSRVSKIGKSMQSMINGKTSSNSTAKKYPKSKYPYLIKISGFKKIDHSNVARYLSKKGKSKFMVVVSSKNIYILQKSRRSAEILFDKILDYSRYSFKGRMKILKR